MSIRDLVPWKWGKKSVPIRRREIEDPFRELQRRMNSLFEEFWSDFGLSPFPLAMPSLEGWGDFAPRIDVTENENQLSVRAELPGMSEKDVEVELANGVLTIRGEKKNERKETREGLHYSECSYGAFHRAIPLPCEIVEDGVQAEFKNGVLTITLPKSEQAKKKSKKIEVKTG